MYTTAELLAIILPLYSTSKHLLKPVFLLQSVESPNTIYLILTILTITQTVQT